MVGERHPMPRVMLGQSFSQNAYVNIRGVSEIYMEGDKSGAITLAACGITSCVVAMPKSGLAKKSRRVSVTSCRIFLTLIDYLRRSKGKCLYWIYTDRR